MKTKVGVFGSCISRDAFNSHFVPNYKDFFEIKFDAQRISMISLMQDPLLIDEKLIEIYPPTAKNKSRTHFLSCDFNKIFLHQLIENDIDILIIDNYFEVLMGILYFENNTIITNNGWDLPDTEFYKKIKDKFVLKIINFTDEYFCIWSKYCDLFFKFLKLNCPNVKVILNQARQVDKIKKSDGTIYINNDFTKELSIVNPLIEKLDSYIIDNYNVHVLKFDYENTFADENHIWGFAPMHYHKNFHHSLINELKKISQDNKLDSIGSKKEKFDETSFKNELYRTKFETEILLKNIKKSVIADSLKIYNRARVDIKNYGSKDNKIKVIKNDDHLLKIDFPTWFKTNEGEGLVIESNNGFINLELKCINDGLLKIYLRSPDIRDKNSDRFPIYIDIIKLNVNNKLILNEHNLVCHDKPYIFEKEVKNSEIIKIHVEWLPFNNNCILNKK